jgi:NAD(P)H-nitrite reductase large subunit
MAIVAVGVRPAVNFLDGSGIAHANGVTVNDYLATTVPGIYAAGDVTGLSGIWPNAMKQGEVAAKNMCGVPTVYDDVFAQKNTVNYFGLVSLAIGEAEPLEGDKQEIRESINSYEKVIVRDGVVVGVILQGNIGGSGFWQYLIKHRIDVSKIKASVFDLSFADFYGVKDNGEYKWVV